MTAVAGAIEELGYDAVAFTEHPAPSREWMQSGGHQSLDVPSALAFCAAVTGSIRLMTYLTVVPYHSPFTVAKAVATVDRLSQGRVAIVAGVGYLRSEFHALGVDFSQRERLLDEGLEIMRGVWPGLPYTYSSERHSAREVVSLPTPLQVDGPPIYIGGTSASARRRAAAHDGWSPLLLGGAGSQPADGSDRIDLDRLGTQISEVRKQAQNLRGSAAKTFVQVQTRASWVHPGGIDAPAVRAHLAALADAGVDSFVVKPVGDCVADAVSALREFADSVGDSRR